MDRATARKALTGSVTRTIDQYKGSFRHFASTLVKGLIEDSNVPAYIAALHAPKSLKTPNQPKPPKGACVSGRLDVDFYARCSELRDKHVTMELNEAVMDDVEERLKDLLKEGYVSGEFHTHVNLDVPGKKTPPDGWAFSGWINIKRTRE